MPRAVATERIARVAPSTARTMRAASAGALRLAYSATTGTSAADSAPGD
jgi:hypothetical protein